MNLVLSLFPGMGMLDHAFSLEGFSVVRGPEWIFGQDIRDWHVPPGRFDGVIGGDPCQSHSGLANLVRAKGLEPSFPDLTPEFLRVIDEAQPRWFLRENVPKAPDLAPEGYSVSKFKLDLSTLDSGDGWGYEQMRKRMFWFGVRGSDAPELRRWMRFALYELPTVQAVSADPRAVSVRRGGSGRVRVTAVGGREGHVDDLGSYRKVKAQAVTGRHHSNEIRTTKKRGDGWVGKQPKRSLEDMLELQGLPGDWLDRQPWTMQAKRKMVGNGVPIGMGRELARAIQCWIEEEES